MAGPVDGAADPQVKSTALKLQQAGIFKAQKPALSHEVASQDPARASISRSCGEGLSPSSREPLPASPAKASKEQGPLSQPAAAELVAGRRRRGKGRHRRGQEALSKAVRPHYFDAGSGSSSSGSASPPIRSHGRGKVQALKHYFEEPEESPDEVVFGWAECPKEHQLQPENDDIRTVVVPLYIGLNLHRYLPVFCELAIAFAQQLKTDFQVELSVPELKASNAAPAPSSVPLAFGATLAPAPLVRDQEEPELAGSWPRSAITASKQPPTASAEATIASALTFRWPHALHMTTFYMGGGLRTSVSSEALEALEMEGREWSVRCTHLVYAHNALLVAALEVVGDHLPLDAGCLPHVTLLARQPFQPGDAAEVLARAHAAGLLELQESGHLLLAPGMPLACSMVDLYVQSLTSTAAPDGALGLLKARLESFWSHRTD